MAANLHPPETPGRHLNLTFDEDQRRRIRERSLWRQFKLAGSVGFPVNLLIIRSLLLLHLYYGDTFKINCLNEPGNLLTLFTITRKISIRPTKVFLRDKTGGAAMADSDGDQSEFDRVLDQLGGGSNTQSFHDVVFM